jgi:hypothetical protein
MRIARLAVPVFFAAIATSATPLTVSDPIGVYALIDRVVLEPEAGKPQRIQVWGVFAFADPKSGPEKYTPAQRGYLYYSVNDANPRVSLAEWSDLNSIAGKGEVIGYGGRYEKNGRLRKANEPASDPDVYPRSYNGIVRMPTFNSPEISRDLLHVPQPVTPVDGATVPAGAIRLTVRSLPDTEAYVFEITPAGGTPETSAPIAAGKNDPSWTPKLRVASGKQYSWRVWAVNGSWRGQPASATFQVK